jgi:hypothetical protein
VSRSAASADPSAKAICAQPGRLCWSGVRSGPAGGSISSSPTPQKSRNTAAAPRPAPGRSARPGRRVGMRRNRAAARAVRFGARRARCGRSATVRCRKSLAGGCARRGRVAARWERRPDRGPAAAPTGVSGPARGSGRSARWRSLLASIPTRNRAPAQGSQGAAARGHRCDGVRRRYAVGGGRRQDVVRASAGRSRRSCGSGPDSSAPSHAGAGPAGVAKTRHGFTRPAV